MRRDYSFVRLVDRAEAALEAHRDYVQKLEADYQQNKELRKAQGLPVLGILGMGRSGKDEAGAYLSQQFQLRPPQSSSLVCLPLVAHMIGIPKDMAYAERHENRQFWIQACHALREHDKTRLARWCLGVCDIAIGYRGKEEFAGINAERIVDLTVWIDRNVPVDPTVEFSRADCDVVIDNHSSLERFHERLRRFGEVLYGRQ